MANKNHAALLKQGVEVWNRWRDENPEIQPALAHANLINAVLRRVNLRGAYLNGALLVRADLSEADLCGADVVNAGLSGANLTGANLSNASLVRALLVEANLTGANLTGARLAHALLVDAKLDGATLTDARLWESSRVGWSIKGVICERCFWDKGKRAKPSEYAPGEFERAFAEKPSIVLQYPDGLRAFDFAMLPLMVEQLQTEHPNTVLHVRSVRDEGGKATVTLVVDDLANRDPGEFLLEVDELRKHLTNIQTLLLRTETERDVYRDEYRALVKDITMKSTKQITIGTMTGGHLGDISHSHDFQTGQTVIYQPNDLDQIRKLIGEIYEKREEVRGVVTEDQFAELQASLDTVRRQLEAAQPDQSAIKKALGSLQRMCEGAMANVVGSGVLEALGRLG